MKFAAILLVLVSAAAAQKSRVDPSEEARSAFFDHSDLKATLALTENARSPELLFLRMEAAALSADTATTLDSALRLCSSVRATDPRGIIAAYRIADLAGNTVQFRQVVPRIQSLISVGSPFASYLRAALLSAAMDGAPDLRALQLAHQSGFITDWRMAGPFGSYSNVAFEQNWPPERDTPKADASANAPVERVRFLDGNVSIPNYFNRDGVFYVAAAINTAETQTRSLVVRSPGTLEVFLDGRSVLRKDDRFRSGPELISANVRLGPGAHRIVVKFIPSAIPFRIAVVPVSAAHANQQSVSGNPVETAFISAAQSYWSGNYTDAILQLSTLQKLSPSVAVDFLLAEAWGKASTDAPERDNLLLTAHKVAQDASLVEFRLSQGAQENGRLDEAWNRVSAVLSNHPDFAPAQQLAAEIAVARHSTSAAEEHFAALEDLHATCANLVEGYKFYSDQNNFDRANEILEKVRNCAPESTAYVQLLSGRGDHQAATVAAADLVSRYPLDREARFLLVRESALAGKLEHATRAAEALAKIAPNSEEFRKLSESNGNILALLKEENVRAREFTESTPFYGPYRRNPLPIIAAAKSRNDSGPAVTLLEDKVSKLRADGTVSVYFHRMVKVLTRSGIETYGEVSLPGNAVLLELRTFAPDGSISEPEFQQHKTSISMPGLLPGSVIEQEYVVHYIDHDGTEGHRNEFTFTFGSFKLPMLSARYTAITPADVTVTTREHNGAPVATASIQDGQRVQAWSRDNIEKLNDEPNLPDRPVLPVVSVFEIPRNGWTEIRDYYRNMLIDATQVGPRTLQAISQLRLSGTDLDKLKTIYAFANSRIRSDRSSIAGGNPTSVEETLAVNFGNRTTTLIGLARAAGLDSDLLLARDISAFPPVTSRSAFTRPLVQVKLRNSTLVADAAFENMTLGTIAPALDRREVLLVPLTNADERVLSTIAQAQSELSIANAELRISPEGDLDVRFTMRLGALRSAQIRNTLSSPDSGGRQEYLNQLASRIFPGAKDITGEVTNQFELDRPLEVNLRCRVPEFLDLSGSSRNMDQLVPTLGLKRMYAVAGSRMFPLYIDTPFVESTTFRVTLPPNVRMSRKIDNTNLRTEFGSYAVAFRDIGNNTFEITRKFEIPVQVIAPARYGQFRSFAERIDDAETQRFTFTRQ